MLSQIVRQQPVFETINGLLSLIGNLLQTNPNQESAGDVISDNPGLATLATFQAGQLLGFAMKLLNLPTKAAYFLYGLGVVLSHVIGHNLVRAPGG